MLKSRQRRFAEHYMLLPTPTEAAVEAGYTGKNPSATASKLLKNPEVQEYIAQLQAVAKEQFNINQGELVQRSRETYVGAFKAGQFTACNQAIQNEAKMGGLMKDQVHVTSLEVRSDEDLIKSLAGGDPVALAALAKALGAAEGFGTPGETSKPTAQGGNPHNGAGTAGNGQTGPG